jgi:HAD superfamily hydrolase (TIGR01490 family)
VNLALFDLDGTLLPNDSDHAFGEFMVKLGWADGAASRARNDQFYADYVAGKLDVHAYLEFATAAWRVRHPHEAEAARVQFMAEVMAPMLRQPARDLVERHRAEGDLLAIVTATNEFVTRPIADAFGIEHLIAVRLARDENGRVSGKIHGVPSYGAGKVHRVHEWLAEHGRTWDDFGRVSFYSDSTNDLPLLELATDPVATNPSPALEAIARERGWRILRLFE